MNASITIPTCSIWRSLEVVGDTPTLLILKANWLGARKFDELRDRTGLLKALLSDRLKRLLDAGLFEKRLYRENPPRFEYGLTQKGRDLYWTALMLMRWETVCGGGLGTIPVALVHEPCGNAFVPEPACGHCGETIDATQIAWARGPGIGVMPPLYSRRRQRRESGLGNAGLMDQAARIMGDRWACLILRSIFTGINRFDDIRQDIAIATNILSERLAWLQSAGLIRQRAYPSTPPRQEYRVTRRGVEYYPVLLMLMRWGDRYYGTPAGPPVLLSHKTCGHTLDPQVVCSCCRRPIMPEAVSFEIAERGH